MGYMDELCGAVSGGDFGVTICAQKNVLALALGILVVNTPKILNMEKMVCCLLEI
jgi:hypothetical protein